MWKLNKHPHEYEVVADGISYGYLPKVGADGLLIIRKLYDGKWNFAIPQGLFDPSVEVWFQTWDGKDYEWFHGIVDGTGKIKQIG